MRLYVWIVIVLSLLVAVGAAFALSPRALSGPDCRNRVVSAQGKDGSALECVCVGRALASCYGP